MFMIFLTIYDNGSNDRILLNTLSHIPIHNIGETIMEKQFISFYVKQSKPVKLVLIQVLKLVKLVMKFVLLLQEIRISILKLNSKISKLATNLRREYFNHPGMYSLLMLCIMPLLVCVMGILNLFGRIDK